MLVTFIVKSLGIGRVLQGCKCEQIVLMGLWMLQTRVAIGHLHIHQETCFQDTHNAMCG